MQRPASINDNSQGEKTFRSTAFRTTMTSREGHIPSRIIDGKIIGVNLVNWTVDVATTFDRHRYLNIQVGSPYMHFSNGEGIYAVPEVGAKCQVCLPSDSSPPYVLCFLMPFEKVNDTSTTDAPNGTRSHGSVMKNATDARFDGGRPKGKPGDIIARGRDGNFVILHRGGVLQIGSTELAQRIFIPLENHVMDISERYSHHNTGGSVQWGLADGRTDNAVSEVETYRVYANDQYADIRISKGLVANPLPTDTSLPDKVIYEVAISPKGFNADSGDIADANTTKSLVYQFALDRSGNVSMTVAGDVFHHYKKKLTIKVDDAIDISSGKGFSLSAKEGMTVDGGKYTQVKGDVIRLGKGDQAVARKGDFVSTKVAIPIPGVVIFPSAPIPGANPCTISFVASLGGVITTGNERVKA